MDACSFDIVVAYQYIAFKVESVIDELISFAEIPVKYDDMKVDKADSDEKFNDYLKTQEEYNLQDIKVEIISTLNKVLIILEIKLLFYF